MTEDGPVTYTVPMAVWDHVESLLKRLVGMSERRGATPLTYEAGDPYLQTITGKVRNTRISGWRRRRSYVPIGEDLYGRMVRDVTVAHWPGADTPWTILGTVEPANPNASGSRPGVWRAAPDEQGHENMPSYVPTVRTRAPPSCSTTGATIAPPVPVVGSRPCCCATRTPVRYATSAPRACSTTWA